MLLLDHQVEVQAISPDKPRRALRAAVDGYWDVAAYALALAREAIQATVPVTVEMGR